MTYDPVHAIAELGAQHAALRGLMDRCESLATEFDGGRIGSLQLTREINRLRIAFDAHNTFEERLLKPVAPATDTVGVVAVDRTIDDHTAVHRSMRKLLTSNVTRDLREVIAMMRTHLEREELELVLPGPIGHGARLHD